MKMNIRTKLIGGFIIVVTMLIAVFGASYNGMNNMGKATEDILEEAKHAEYIMEIEVNVQEEWQFYTDYALTHDEEALREAREKASHITAVVGELELIMTAKEIRQLE